MPAGSTSTSRTSPCRWRCATPRRWPAWASPTSWARSAAASSHPPASRTQDTAPWYVALRRIDAWRLHHDPLLRRGLRRGRVRAGHRAVRRRGAGRDPFRALRTCPRPPSSRCPWPASRGSRTEARCACCSSAGWCAPRARATPSPRWPICATSTSSSTSSATASTAPPARSWPHDLGVGDRVGFRGAPARERGRGASTGRPTSSSSPASVSPAATWSSRRWVTGCRWS